MHRVRWMPRLRSALVALALPAAAAAQPPVEPDDAFSPLVRRWSMSGCGRGTVIARPEIVTGDVVCLRGFASWGRRPGDGRWDLTFDFFQENSPLIDFGPFFEGNGSFLRFTYVAPGSECEAGCEDGTNDLSESESPDGLSGRSVITTSYPTALAAEEGMDPYSFRLTEVELLYVYVPRGDDDELGVTVSLVPVLVPEPSTWALMGTGLLGLLVVARRRR